MTAAGRLRSSTLCRRVRESALRMAIESYRGHHLSACLSHLAEACSCGLTYLLEAAKSLGVKVEE